MKTFSISELEQYSLIKAHTFRMWEKRYGIFKGQRTPTNLRFYSFDEFAFLLDFSLLNRFGHKISALATMDKNSIRQQLYNLSTEEATKQHQINQLVVCMFSLNIEDFELILDGAVSSWGIESTIEDIILPFLERMELFSYEDRTSGEFHFAVTALRKKLILAIEQTAPKKQVATTALLFLPENQHFDLLLLYLTYKLKNSGLNVLYLGTNVPACHLQEVIDKKKPHFVISYISPNDKKSIHRLSPCFQKTNGTTFYLMATGKLPKDYNLPLWKVKFIEYKDVPNEVLQLTRLLYGNTVKNS